MQEPLRIVLIESRHTDHGIAARLLTDRHLNFSWQCAASEAELGKVVERFRPDIALSIDCASVNSNRRLLETLRLLCSQTPVILVSSVDEGGSAAAGRAVAGAPPLRVAQYTADLRRGFASVLESSAEPAVMTNSEGWITHANTAACRMLELRGRSLITVLRTTQHQYPAIPHWLHISPDEERWSDVAAARGDAASEPCQRRLACFDSWSLLPTLVHVDDLIGCLTMHQNEHRATLSLIGVDRDSGRLPGDEYGRMLGDADGVRSSPPCDTARHGCIVRISPDDFMVVLPHPLPPGRAAIALERTLDSIEISRSLPGSAAACTDIDASPSRPARAAVRDASALHRSAPPSHVPRDAHRMDRTGHEPALDEAMQRHALSVHYQPQFDVRTGRGCGVEALARWELCSGESVAPSVFIPAAERSGLIHVLGAWMLGSACETAYAWCGREAQRTTLSVNVSALQIDEDFNAVLGRTLEKSHFPAKQLELEITESALIANPDVTIGYLKQWKEMGVRIAMDDFGTGYSSLSYLSRLPVDCLKLDQSLIHRMTQDVKTAAVTRLIVSMAAELGIDIVAEGVETEPQLKMLADLNCPRVQGYLLGRPMPAKQAQIVLRKPWGNRPLSVQPRAGAAAMVSHA